MGREEGVSVWWWIFAQECRARGCVCSERRLANLRRRSASCVLKLVVVELCINIHGRASGGGASRALTVVGWSSGISALRCGGGGRRRLLLHCQGGTRLRWQRGGGRVRGNWVVGAVWLIKRQHCAAHEALVRRNRRTHAGPRVLNRDGILSCVSPENVYVSWPGYASLRIQLTPSIRTARSGGAAARAAANNAPAGTGPFKSCESHSSKGRLRGGS